MNEFGQGADAKAPEQPVSALAAASAVLRNARLVLLLAVLGGLAGLLYARVRASYTAESEFAIQAQSAPSSSLLGVAEQFGFDVPSMGGSNSVEFYVRLLDTGDLLREVVEHDFRFVSRPRSDELISGDLVELFDIHEDTREDAVQEALDVLRDRLRVFPRAAAGVVSISVEDPRPMLAEQINRRLLDLISRFNLETRQSRAKVEREFVEERLEVASQELEDAEVAAEQFRTANRIITGSPELELQLERLQRRVSIRQQVYANLVQAYETARIDEVRDTPVITVIDAPEGSAVRDRSGTVTAVVAAGIGLFLGVVIAVVRAYLRMAKTSEPEQWDELVRAARGILPGGRS